MVAVASQHARPRAGSADLDDTRSDNIRWYIQAWASGKTDDTQHAFWKHTDDTQHKIQTTVDHTAHELRKQIDDAQHTIWKAYRIHTLGRCVLRSPPTKNT